MIKIILIALLYIFVGNVIVFVAQIFEPDCLEIEVYIFAVFLWPLFLIIIIFSALHEYSYTLALKVRKYFNLDNSED